MCDGGVLLAQSSHDAVYPGRVQAEPNNSHECDSPPSLQRLQVDVAFADVFLLRFSFFYF